MKPPYGQNFVLTTPLEDVECWNRTDGKLWTIPAGTTVLVCHVNDATHTTVQVVAGPALVMRHGALGLPLSSLEDVGYRFIVENQTLGDAIGVEMPKRTADLIGDLIAYESGEATPTQTRRLFRKLKSTGIGSRLQGHYSSRM